MITALEVLASVGAGAWIALSIGRRIVRTGERRGLARAYAIVLREEIDSNTRRAAARLRGDAITEDRELAARDAAWRIADEIAAERVRTLLR